MAKRESALAPRNVYAAAPAMSAPAPDARLQRADGLPRPHLGGAVSAVEHVVLWRAACGRDHSGRRPIEAGGLVASHAPALRLLRLIRLK